MPVQLQRNPKCAGLGPRSQFYVFAEREAIMSTMFEKEAQNYVMLLIHHCCGKGVLRGRKSD